MAALPPLPIRQKRRYSTKSQTSADIDSFRSAAAAAKEIENGSYSSAVYQRAGGTPPRTVPRASILNDISVGAINYPRVSRSPSCGSVTSKRTSGLIGILKLNSKSATNYEKLATNGNESVDEDDDSPSSTSSKRISGKNGILKLNTKSVDGADKKSTNGNGTVRSESGADDNSVGSTLTKRTSGISGVLKLNTKPLDGVDKKSTNSNGTVKSESGVDDNSAGSTLTKRTSGISGILKLNTNSTLDSADKKLTSVGTVKSKLDDNNSNVYASMRSSLKSASKPEPKIEPVKSKPKPVDSSLAKVSVLERSQIFSTPKSSGPVLNKKVNNLGTKIESSCQTSPMLPRAPIAKQVVVNNSEKLNGSGNTVENKNVSGELRDLINQNSARNIRVYKNRSGSVTALNGITSGKLRLETSFPRSFDPVLIECCKQSDYFKLIKLIDDRSPAVIGERYVNVFDDIGKTPLIYAVINNDVSIVKELCKIPGLDVNLQDLDGNTSLHLAAQGGYAEVLNLLTMVGGVELNKRNYAGITPLMKAALQGKSRCIRILLVAGAAPDFRDPKKNFCAYDWALYCGRKACAEMILRYAEASAKGASAKIKWNSEPDLKSSKLIKSLSFVGKVWKNVTGGKADPPPLALKRQLSVSAELTKIGLAASMTSLPDVVPREISSIRPKLIIPRIEISFWSPAMANTIPPPPARSPPKMNEGGDPPSAGEKAQQRRQSNPPLYAVRSKGIIEVKFPVQFHKE